MMSNNENSEKFEAFKAGLLKWKNEHREEYNEFARHMSNCDGSYYYHIFKAVSSQMSHIAKEWELSWGDDADVTFDSMFMQVAKENLPKQIADMFAVPVPDAERNGGLISMVRRVFGIKPKKQVKLSAPLVLNWLFYGKSFESMVAMMDKQLADKSMERSDRLKCSSAVRAIISVSIKSGYRTKEDWERHFTKENSSNENITGEWALQDVLKDIPVETDAPTKVETDNVQHATAGRKKSKECPLVDYLPSDSCEAILSCIRKFITEHPSAMHQALPFFVLKDLPLRLPLCNGVEYGIALTKQFPDVSELRSDHSIRQAVGKLAGKETLMLIKDGKTQMCRYIESDEYQELLELLRNDLCRLT